jgi:Tol biopolymer transport system component
VVATPEPASSVDKIAFASTRGAAGKPDIYLMNADGSGLARLTDDPAAG